MKSMLKGAAVAFLAYGMMMSGSVMAAPATACTQDNEGDFEYVSNPRGDGMTVYQCLLGEWRRVAVCDGSGVNCVWI